MEYSNEIERVVIKTNDNPEATGFIHNINKIQYNTLQKFKDKLIAEKTLSDFSVYDDIYLLKFLRARKFDIDKTNLMFTEFMKWRAKENVDEIENTRFEDILELKKYFPHTYHKTDKIVIILSY
jgi:hypothetical protein